MRPDALEVHNSLPFVDENDKSDLQKILQLWEAHCVPSTNVIFDRYTFHHRTQTPGEPFDSFLTALRQAAATCDYGNLQDEFIRDKIVRGIHDDSLRKRLLQESKLDLTRCNAMCKAAEVSKQQLTQFKAENVHQTKELPILKHCRYCGGTHQYGKVNCPAADKKCRKCGEMNHFAQMCRGQTKDRPGPRQSGPSSSNRPPPSRSGSARPRQVHTVDEYYQDQREEEVLTLTHEEGADQEKPVQLPAAASSPPASDVSSTIARGGAGA